MANQIAWFDIPASNIDRAIKFYSAVLKQKIEKSKFPGMAMGVLPHSENDVSGCLYHAADAKPSDKGILVYFNCDGRLDDAIAQVEKNGGKVLQAKHQIGPYGWKAVVSDSEGNRVALHSK